MPQDLPEKMFYWPLLQFLMAQPGNHVTALGEQGSVHGALGKQLSPPPFAPPSLRKKVNKKHNEVQDNGLAAEAVLINTHGSWHLTDKGCPDPCGGCREGKPQSHQKPN